MLRKTLSVAAIVLAIVVGIAVAYPWESQKKNASVFRRNLSGTAPTAAELSTNFVQVGDFVVDTSNNDTYQVLNLNVPLFLKVASNGTFTITSLAGDLTSDYSTIGTGTFVKVDVSPGTLQYGGGAGGTNAVVQDTADYATIGTGTLYKLSVTVVNVGGVAGISRIITNQSSGFTNLLYLNNGIVTNFSYDPVP